MPCEVMQEMCKYVLEAINQGNIEHMAQMFFISMYSFVTIGSRMVSCTPYVYNRPL